jgi:hypothetical protein
MPSQVPPRYVHNVSSGARRTSDIVRMTSRRLQPGSDAYFTFAVMGRQRMVRPMPTADSMTF